MAKATGRLSWERRDFERILGFRSKKFTGVNYLLTGILGLLATAAFYAILYQFQGRGIDLIDMFFHFDGRSTLPYYTVFFAWWAAAILFVKRRKLALQRKALTLDLLPHDPNFVLSPLTAREIIDNVYRQVEDPRRFVLLDRIERVLANLKNLGDLNDVSTSFKEQAENDDNYLSSSYTVVKGFVWAIPVLGFIGTVIGLSEAIGGFGKVVARGASLDELKNALGGVTGGLATAFETTLIALVAALIVQLLLTFTQSREEAFLDECSDYCHRNLISKLRTATLKTPEPLPPEER